MIYSKISLSILIATTCALSPLPASAAPTASDLQTVMQSSAGADPGRELQDAQQRREAERVRQEMQAQQNAPGGTIEHATPDEETPAAGTRFVLTSVTVDASALLPDDVVKASYADAIGKESSLDDLYAIVARLNDWYAAHSYLTCRAYLPPQTIHAGAVHIALIEGKNGDVTVTGNRSTSSGYIKDRLAVAPGEIERMSDLQHRLDWFNGTNDVKLHITLQAGKAPGTTDYVITASEPPRRDTLTLSGLHAKGLDSFSAGYELPVGRRGARVAFDYSTNSTEVIDGFYKQWDIPVKGHASYLSATLTQPLAVSYRGKTEASLAFTQTHSRTDVEGVTSLIDDTFRDVTAALTK